MITEQARATATDWHGGSSSPMTTPCPTRDYFPAPIDLILVDAHLLFTRPPEGAATLADVVQRIAGGTLRAERARPALAVTPGGVTPSPGADLLEVTP